MYKIYFLIVLRTNSVNKQLGFGWEIVINYIVQHGNVYSTCSQVSNNQCHCLLAAEFCNLQSNGTCCSSLVLFSSVDLLVAELWLRAHLHPATATPLWRHYEWVAKPFPSAGLIRQFCKKKKAKKAQNHKKKALFTPKKHFLMGIFNINLPFSSDYCTVFVI